MKIKRISNFSEIEYEPNTIFIIGEEGDPELYADRPASSFATLPFYPNPATPLSEPYTDNDPAYLPLQNDRYLKVQNEITPAVQRLGAKDFYLYLMFINRAEEISTFIPLTAFVEGKSSPYGTFNEQLDIIENEQYKLSFQIAKTVEGYDNPYYELMKNGQLLRYQTYRERIDFTITSITPKIYASNIILSVEAESSFSYTMRKRGAGYETLIDEFDPLSFWAMPHKIDTLVEQILNENKVKNWTIDSAFKARELAPFPDELYKFTTQEGQRHMKMCLSINDSNVYNALVETMKLFGASLEIRYNDMGTGGTISFINNRNVRFKGYRLRPTVNLKDMTFSSKSEDFCSVLKVFGSETADGDYVSMLPTMPDAIKEYIQALVAEEFSDTDLENLSFFDEEQWNGTMNEHFSHLALGLSNEDSEYLLGYCDVIDTYMPSLESALYNVDYLVEAGVVEEDAKKKIEKVLRKMRNANLIVQAYTFAYNTLLFEYNSFKDQEDEIIQWMVSEHRASLKEGGDGTSERITELEAELASLYDNGYRPLIKQLFQTEVNFKVSRGISDEQDRVNAEYREYFENAKAYLQTYLDRGGISIEELQKGTSVELNAKYAAEISKANKTELFVPKLLDIDVISGVATIIDKYDKPNQKGFYEFLIQGIEVNCIEELQSNYSLKGLLTEANNARNKYEAELESYRDILLERIYSDDAQLTPDGLYLAAAKEFAVYNRPTTEYSATVINYSALMDNFKQEIEVGDVIYVYNRDLWCKDCSVLNIAVAEDFNWKDKESFKLVKNKGDENPLEVKVFDSTIETIRTFYGIQAVRMLKATVESEIADMGEYSGLIYQGEEEPIEILWLGFDKVEVEQELAVTGISKKLREPIMNLTVKNNKTIDAILNKLLMSVRRR